MELGSVNNANIFHQIREAFGNSINTQDVEGSAKKPCRLVCLSICVLLVISVIILIQIFL